MNNDLNTAKTAAIAAAVKTIKAAILQSRYQAARLANAEMLKLYFAIGGYVSANSRAGTWGTGPLTRFPSDCRRNCRDCAAFPRQT